MHANSAICIYIHIVQEMYYLASIRSNTAFQFFDHFMTIKLIQLFVECKIIFIRKWMECFLGG